MVPSEPALPHSIAEPGLDRKAKPDQSAAGPSPPPYRHHLPFHEAVLKLLLKAAIL